MASGIYQSWRRPLVLGAFLLILGISFAARRVVVRHRTPSLEKYGQVSAFELTNESAQAYGTKQLIGKVWIANFIFTRCPNICPSFSAKMAAVQQQTEAAGENLHLVSFSVDPEFDQPAVLKSYGEKFKANPTRWNFLTSTRSNMEKVVIGSMKMPMEQGAKTDLMSVAHGSYFVLVDQQLQIRGFYRFDDKDAVARVVRDAGQLLSGK